MFIAEYDVDEVKGEVCKLLKKWGVKLRSKKFNLKTLERKEVVGVFKFHLEILRQVKAKIIQFDQYIQVPVFLLDICNHLRENIETEGIFRKSGVAARQKELKQIITNGGRIQSDYKAIDVADLLKLFFRELPEPCIPYMFHDSLERCYDVSGRRKDAVFLTLLMLPTVYLHTLAYLMQFLHEVAAHSMYNQMDASNLAIVWIPNLMPFKTGRVNDKGAFEKRVAILQMLIEEADQIGVVPECLLHNLPSWHPSTSLSSHDELEQSRPRYTKKKRRSGSLTRMISGIKKMVKSKVAEETEAVTPDNSVFVAHTPRIMSTGKKRKASVSNLTAFSSKKRKDVLDSLPQGAILPDICTTTHLTPRVLLPQVDRKTKQRSLSTSRLKLSSFGFSKKNHRKAEKMEDSGLELTATPDALDMTTSSEDYVRISRSEYEDIKNRVSRIESRISTEFENIGAGVSLSDLESTPDKSASNCAKIVQSVYEKTLESAEKFNSPTSDELATRLSRELNIRGSSRKKVIRSPSARKIGSIRRRSRERVPRVKRNLSLNIGNKKLSHQGSYNDLRRRNSNPQNNDLPNSLVVSRHDLQDSFKFHLKSEAFENQRESLSHSFDLKSLNLSDFGVMTRSQARRASSFHDVDLSKVPSVTVENRNEPQCSIVWKSAETFLKEEEKREGQSNTGRPSLAKIRTQNAGMVLEKAKMFNTMIYSDDTKTKKSNDTCQVIKKRNSSKSSSDKRLQRKRSGNQKDGDSQKVPIEGKNYYTSASLPTKTNVMNSKENVKALQKNSIQDKKAVDRHFAVSKLKNNNLHVHSPLRERNKIMTPSKKCTPSLQPSHVRSALVKSISTTPRRSPRQLSCKQKYGIK